MKQLFVILLTTLFISPVLATPQIEHWETSNGARVYYVHAPELPMYDVRVIFDAGSARDGNAYGLAKLTNALLTEAAGDWSAQELAQRMEDIGAQYSSQSLKDMAIVSGRSLSNMEYQPVLLSSMKAMLTHPAFKQEDFDRVKNQMLVGIEQAKQSAGSVVSKAFYKAIYGQHPYAHDAGGTSESINAISLNDVKQFHKKYYVANNAMIAIVGDVDRKTAEKLAEQLVSDLPDGDKAPQLPPVTPLDKKQLVDIEFPSTQIHIRMGQPGMSRIDEDFFPLYVGNHILGGGGLVSQLILEVREARGLAYSASSSFIPMRARGPFLAGASTRKNKAQESLEVMTQTIKDFIANGPSEEQLKNAKANIIGGYPLRIASNSKIIEYLGLIGFYGYPLDYLDSFTKKVDAVTKEQIQKAFERRLNPNNFAVVRVGDLSAKKRTQ